MCGCEACRPSSSRNWSISARETIGHPSGQRAKTVTVRRFIEFRGAALAGQRLPGELGQHRAGWPVLPDSSFTHCVENIAIDAQRGAHASDARASHQLFRAPAREWVPF